MISRIRIALLTSVVMASALCSIRADDKSFGDQEKKAPVVGQKDAKKEAIPAPVAPVAPVAPAAVDSCAPAYTTVCVTEWVPESYKTTRTTYKKECVPETYTAYKTECIPETRTRNVTHYERVCETRDVVKTICEKVCVQEERTCMKAHWTCVPVTTMTCKTVDKGHFECKEVPCGPSLLAGLREKLSRCGASSCGCAAQTCGCAAPACGCAAPACNTCCAPATKTVKVWVSCKVTEQVPCTKMERKCEMVAEKTMVNVWKSVPKTVTCKENVVKCVPVCKTETYTVNTQKCVAYQATRMVSRCVPVTEEVTCCRMVAKTVQKQVPACNTCNTCAAPSTCSTCNTCSTSLRDKLNGLFAGFNKHSCGCSSACSTCGGGCSTCGH